MFKIRGHRVRKQQRQLLRAEDEGGLRLESEVTVPGARILQVMTRPGIMRVMMMVTLRARSSSPARASGQTQFSSNLQYYRPQEVPSVCQHYVNCQ